MLSDSKPKEVTTAITIAPPRSLALYSPSYMSQAAEQAAQPLANAPMGKICLAYMRSLVNGHFIDTTVLHLIDNNMKRN